MCFLISACTSDIFCHTSTNVRVRSDDIICQSATCKRAEHISPARHDQLTSDLAYLLRLFEVQYRVASSRVAANWCACQISCKAMSALPYSAVLRQKSKGSLGTSVAKLPQPSPGTSSLSSVVNKIALCSPLMQLSVDLIDPNT